MNKILRYSFIALLAMIGMTASASTIVFGDLNLENGVQYSDPFDAGDFTVTFAGGTNDGKYYNTGSGIRVYGGGTMTITAKSGTLTKLVITYDGSNKPESADVVNVGTYDVETGVWTGDAASVVFTRPSGSGHWRIQKVSNEESSDDDDPSTDEPSGDETNYGTKDAPLTVAEAIAIANAAGTTATTEDVYTKGVVTEITTAWSSQYKNVSFNISNDNGTTVLLVYRCKSEAEDYVLVGDEVVIKGKLKMYNGAPEYDANCEIVELKQGDAHNIPVETAEAADIAAFKAMETGVKVILTLTDAQVIGVGNKYMVVKDATGALNLYNTNLSFTLGQILNGTITGQTGEYKSIKQLSNMSENTLTATDGSITYTVATVAEVAEAEPLAGPFRIEGAVVKKDGNNFYIMNGDAQAIQLYDQFKYEGLELAEGTFDIEGVTGYYNNAQFWPNSITVSTGINEAKVAKEFNGAIYNVAGQMVTSSYKGLVIKNGKKYIQK